MSDRIQTVIGTVEFEDLGAGSFYLVVSPETKYKIVFDFSTPGVYDSLKTLSETGELYTVLGFVSEPDPDQFSLNPSTVPTITLSGAGVVR